MKPFYIILLLLSLLLISACNTATQAPAPISTEAAAPGITQAGPTSPAQTPAEATQSAALSITTQPGSLPTQSPNEPPAASLPPDPTPTPLPTLAPEAWKTLPVIPEISDHVIEIYQRGQELGNNPGAFSKLGDCGSTPSWFLGDFDRGPSYYSLGAYQELAGVIEQYSGSFGRTSLAARSGFNASSLFVTLWADRSQCESNETPLACEIRLQRPSVALITLGANDVWHPDEFEPQMRKIIDFLLEKGVIPVLATKPDNQEGDGKINAIIARLAREYDIPLWNYWRAVQELPDQGLQEDGVHLTWGRNFFDDPEVMQKAWPVRNLTALQMLHAIWSKLSIYP